MVLHDILGDTVYRLVEVAAFPVGKAFARIPMAVLTRPAGIGAD